MSFLGGAFNTLDPSERLCHSLTRDLELRRNDERTAARFSGYAYQGGADLVLKHGSFHQGRELPSQYVPLKGPESGCYATALQACHANPTLVYCEGYMTAGFGTPISHGWCLAPDGKVVELTLPTLPEELDRYFNTLKLPFVHPSRWAYYGVTFATSLVDRLYTDETHGLPLLDRGPAELAEAEAEARWGTLDVSEVHDFPILKVPYNPHRTEVPT